MQAPLPPGEKERLETLRRYRILDTPRESDFDDLVRLAAQICQAPISLVSLVDQDRQWFKGRYGLDVAETPRRLSFCAHSILQAPAMTEVPDATRDSRFADNELVTGSPGIRFYAGAPLVTPEGQALGTLCVIDTKPRELTPEQQEALRVLSRQVMTQLELRRSLAELEQAHRESAAAHRQESTRLETAVRERTAELVHVNAQLRQSEERLRLFIEHAPVATAMFDRQMRYLAYSRRWQEHYAPDVPDLRGKGHYDLWPDLPQRWKQAHQRGLAGEVVHCDEDVHQGRDGLRHWTRWEVRPWRNADGSVGGIVVLTEDITERKRMQDALQQSHEKLECLVRERTAQLVEANANLQNFAHTAAHDLRSPLRAIHSFTSLALAQYGERLDAMGRSLLERVVGSAAQMDSLLNDLLEYCQIAQQDLRLEKVPLEGAVREALRLLEDDIRAKQADVRLEPPLPDVIGHPATVVMLITNLVSNGLKFVAAGVSPRLRIWAEPQSGITGLMDKGISGAADPGRAPLGPSSPNSPSPNPSIHQSPPPPIHKSIHPPIPQSPNPAQPNRPSLGRGQRHRHRPGRPAQSLWRFPAPAGQRRLPRHRPGPGHRAQRGRTHGRTRRPGVPTRPRQPLLDRTAGLLMEPSSILCPVPPLEYCPQGHRSLR